MWHVPSRLHLSRNLWSLRAVSKRRICEEQRKVRGLSLWPLRPHCARGQLSRLWRWFLHGQHDFRNEMHELVRKMNRADDPNTPARADSPIFPSLGASPIPLFVHSEPGKYSLGLTTICTLCELGKAQGALGQSQCESCNPGTYASEVGSIKCEPCANGTYTASGLPGGSECQGCPAGKHGLLAGIPGAHYSVCSDCPAGRSQPASTRATCRWQRAERSASSASTDPYDGYLP